MKVAFIFPRFSGPYGAEKIILNLTNELISYGHEITIYTHRFSGSCVKLLNNNIRVKETGFLPIENHDIATFLDLLLMPYLGIKVKGEYDIIHAMNWQSIFGAYLTKKFHFRNRDIPILYHCTEPPRLVYDLKNLTFSGVPIYKRILLRFILPFLKWIDIFSVKNSNKIISISDWTQGQVKKIYGRNSDIVYPGIEVDLFREYSKKEARDLIGIDRNIKLFLSVSKLHRRKRIKSALDIYHEHSKKFNNSKLIIIGEGPEKSNLIEYVKIKDYKNVEFVGELPYEDLPPHYIASDYFIFTAKDEPFGLAPLEAKAAGCIGLGEKRPYPIISWNESAGEIDKIYGKL